YLMRLHANVAVGVLPECKILPRGRRRGWNGRKSCHPQPGLRERRCGFFPHHICQEALTAVEPGGAADALLDQRYEPLCLAQTHRPLSRIRLKVEHHQLVRRQVSDAEEVINLAGNVSPAREVISAPKQARPLGGRTVLVIGGIRELSPLCSFV